jgi:hypothetical protein
VTNQKPFQAETDLDQAPADARQVCWLWQAAASVVGAMVTETELASERHLAAERWPSWDAYLQLWA